jgi:rhodanese-related sulfurtransferase
MNSPVPTLGVTEAFELLRAGAPLVDVREPDEFAHIHASGARLVPLNTMPEHLQDWQDHLLTEGQPPVYVICLSGGRSHAAAAWMISQGINAVNIAGGTQAWVAAQLPTESSETE